MQTRKCHVNANETPTPTGSAPKTVPLPFGGGHNFLLHRDFVNIYAVEAAHLFSGNQLWGRIEWHPSMYHPYAWEIFTRMLTHSFGGPSIYSHKHSLANSFTHSHLEVCLFTRSLTCSLTPFIHSLGGLSFYYQIYVLTESLTPSLEYVCLFLAHLHARLFTTCLSIHPLAHSPITHSLTHSLAGSLVGSYLKVVYCFSQPFTRLLTDSHSLAHSLYGACSLSH